MSAAMSSSLSVGNFLPASSINSSQLISLTLAASYSPSNLMLDEDSASDNLTFSITSSLTNAHLLPSHLNNSTFLESITASPSTDTSSTAPTNVLTALKIIKISLLAVIFVLIFCGNLFVLLALHVSSFICLFAFLFVSLSIFNVKSSSPTSSSHSHFIFEKKH